jgi:MFS family permease
VITLALPAGRGLRTAASGGEEQTIDESPGEAQRQLFSDRVLRVVDDAVSWAIAALLVAGSVIPLVAQVNTFLKRSGTGERGRTWLRPTPLRGHPAPRMAAMIRMVLRAAVFLGSSAVGLLVAAWLIPGVSVSVSGFITAVVVFSVAQAILAPFILKMASRYASAFLGGIGLVSTLAALILAAVLTHGFSVRGLGSWVAATVVVWLVTAIATLLLPVLVLGRKTGSSR